MGKSKNPVCGIYIIHNTENSKVYIGSSTDIRKRWMQHKSDLTKGRHNNSHLQASYNKYGKEVFIYSIVELCELEELLVKEEYWIEFYGSLKSLKGYNQELPSSRIRRESEYKEKRSRKLVSHARTIVVTNKETGEIVGEYPSIAEASRIVGLKAQRISDIARNIANSIKGNRSNKSWRGLVFSYKG